MIEEIYNLSCNSYLKTYVIERSNYVQTGNENTWQPKLRPAVIVCPGGGYKYIADSENEPIIFKFLANGYSAFSLHYSLNEESRYPTPLIELFKSIMFIRNNSKRFAIDPNAIIVCGCSAGGHLAGLAATQYKLENIKNIMCCEEDCYKPNAVIMCYPITDVANLNEKFPARLKTWGGMLYPFNPMANLIDFVNKEMAPVFIWHTKTDGIVPVNQSLSLICKMNECGVEYESHIFGVGFHGLCTNDKLSNYKGGIMNGKLVPNVDMWVEMASKWIDYRFNF